MQNIFEQLTDLLKKDERLISHDNIILKNKTQELAHKNDSELIKLLLSDKSIKNYFFFEVEKTLIFDKEKFIRFISNKQFLPDSYTAFKNKIGLTANDEYVNENKEVVLAWPYKDCVLEGGMTKEDQKRDEIFYNETLAPDDINRLLDAKVFTNFKRIDKKGEHKLDEFKRDEKGTIKDNLIIKGNNLLALASLKKEFAGKVKLIYIDPPYNTENGSFNYNDTFNHSSWLVFMKNRLEIAKDLLAENGSIYINIDYNEVHYLKVLMDEIFGKNNFQREIIWRMGFVSGYKTIVKNFIRNHDTILFYSKNYTSLDFNKIYIQNKDFKELVSLSEDIKKQFKQYGINEKTTKELFEYINHTQRGEQYPLEDTWNCNKWDNLDSIAIESSTSRVGETVSLDEENFKGQKPEKLIKRIIESSSNEGDIVLDFFIGTGTTCVTAHKINRQYIGIEQMDYINNTAVPRLKKVINGDNDGISELVNWKGGGGFVYMELAKWNKEWIENIEKAKTGKELANLWSEMKEKAFLNFKLYPKMIDASAKDFADLSITDQKNFLIECLDKNNLYVNLSEIEDKEYEVCKEDIKLNREFYKQKHA
ncbi:MAG: site-specific DNA-methyltransferase [Candidatus Gracilibacteria bacterium]|nr:site-specific DNA-methyltransferase [Candidatus Gracilibacteria bacterium]